MMRFRFGDKDYAIGFEYDTKNVAPWLNFYLPPGSPPNATACSIYEGPAGGPSGEMRAVLRGDAVRSPKDPFRKEAGRKVALRRALESCPKEFRTACWKAYFGRKG